MDAAVTGGIRAADTNRNRNHKRRHRVTSILKLAMDSLSLHLCKTYANKWRQILALTSRHPVRPLPIFALFSIKKWSGLPFDRRPEEAGGGGGTNFIAPFADFN